MKYHFNFVYTTKSQLGICNQTVSILQVQTSKLDLRFIWSG